MEHLQATQLLSEHDTGRLSPAEIQALDGHIARCQECRGWIATYGLLAEASSRQHLGSQDLCDFALEAPGLSRAARERCERHLEGCSECRREVSLVRSGVLESTEGVLVNPSFAGGGRKLASWPRGLAIAATLVLLIGGLVMASRLHIPVTDEYRLVGESVQEDRSIEASRSILVEATKVKTGSQLSMQSEVVVFGDGFFVESGAALTVVTNEPSNEEDSFRS